jgi:cyanate permease
VLAAAGVALVSGWLLVRAERRAAEPVIPAGLVRGTERALSLIGASGNSMVWFALILLVPLRLQLVLGASATVAGALLTPGVILGPLCAFVAGQIMGRTGHYRATCVLAGVFQVAGVGGLLLAPADMGQLWTTTCFVLASIGTGFGGPTFVVVYQNAIPYRLLGAGTGLLSLSRQFGASLGTAMAGSIVGAAAATASGTAVAESLQVALALPFVAAASVLAAAVFTPNRPLRTTIAEADEAGPFRATLERRGRSMLSR